MRKQKNNNKASQGYWKTRIFRPTYSRNGATSESPNFCVEIQHEGKRVRWSLGPGDLTVCAERAKSMYLSLIKNGWDATLEKYKPAAQKQHDPTIGQFIEALTATADIKPKTLAGYVGTLRKIVADIADLADDPAKHGHGQGREEWLARVHAVKLSALTPKAVQEWKRSFLAGAEQDPISQRSARVSVNSFLRAARGLFGPQITKNLGLELPSPLPFSQVEFEPGQNTKYRSTFDIRQLIESARDELSTNDPEAFKVFLLGSMVGLRRKEIDLLEWSSFHWDTGEILIEATKHFAAKSEDSYAPVAIDAELGALFRGYQARATGQFVIESDGEIRSGAIYNSYRCKPVFTRLVAWLRAHGVHTLKPLHTLRKEFGSMLCAAYGIHAASRGLRHSTVAVTDKFYTDSRTRATVGLGHLIEPNKIVEFKQAV